MSLPSIIGNLKTRLLQGPLKPGSFISNVLTVLAGRALAQIIGIVAIPILATMFAPEDFGTLATFNAVVTILVVVANLSYQSAIVLPNRDESAFTLLISCLGIALLVSILAGIGIYLYGDRIAALMNMPVLVDALWFAPFSILALAWFQAFTMWNTRKKQFYLNSQGVVFSKFTTAGTQLGMGALSTSGQGLIIGQLAGQAAGAAHLGLKTFPAIPGHYWRHVNLKRIALLLNRFRRFPAYDLFSSLSSAIARNLPVILLSYFFSAATVGFFSIAYRLLAGPLQLGGSAITRVFFQRANEAKRSGDLPDITLRAFQRLAALFLTPMVLIALAAPEIVLLFFGEEWIDTAIYLRWLTVWIFFASIAAPLHRLFAILEKQHELAVINGTLFFVSAAALIAGGLLGDPMLAIAMFCLSSAFVWFIQGLRILTIAGVRISDYFKTLSKEILLMLPFAIFLAGCQWYTQDPLTVTTLMVGSLGVFGLTRARFMLGANR